MINVDQDRELELTGAKLFFLKQIPLSEISDNGVEKTIRAYRSKSICLVGALTALRRFDDYFKTWIHIGKMLEELFV